MPSRPFTALVAALLLTGLAGCGNDRTPVPDVTTPGPPLGMIKTSFPKAGLSLKAPGGWSQQPGAPPLVVTIATGRATIAIWRYPRTEPLPASRPALDAALASLQAAAKARDSTFTAIKAGRTKIGGRPAVEVRATETIDGQPRIVRSAHVYTDGAEYVIDAFAPPPTFLPVDAQVFRPLLDSIAFTHRDKRTGATGATGGHTGPTGATGGSTGSTGATTGPTGATGASTGPTGATSRP